MSGIVEPRVKKIRKIFNHKRYKELFENPPEKLPNWNGDLFHVDKDVFRKLLQYAHGMVFRILDVFGLFGGGEGSGKSTDASQIGAQFHYILVECNVLNKEVGTYYEYTEDNCMGHDLEEYLNLAHKYNDEIFRIIICDEAGDLKGEDRWDENNKIFRDDMRKDRKKLRISLICYPNPWELVKDFTLGRTNFVRINDFSTNKNDQEPIPDRVHMVIIPRGLYTYSFHTKELIKRAEIKKALLDLSKERYTSELDKKYIFKTVKKDDVFCFNAAKYIKKAKEVSRMKKKEKKLFVSDSVIRILAPRLTASKIGLSRTVNKNLQGEARKQQEEERKQCLLINSFVHQLKDRYKKMEDKNE